LASTIITGGSRGLGFEITRALAADNVQVVVVSRASSEVLDQLIALHPNVSHVPLDLADHDAIEPAIKEIHKRRGPITALVNNAAIGIDGILTNLKRRDIEATLAVNLTAPILLSRAVAKTMIANGRGRIINVSSINAATGYSGLSVYAASKAGLIGFTKSLARELGPAGITVNAVAPGFFESDLVASMDITKRDKVRRRSPLNRFATPPEVANAVLFLLSEQSSGMTGTVITVDAGNSA
jgi:3-oxoacyl-[acyl-carrier protein] reductase